MCISSITLLGTPPYSLPSLLFMCRAAGGGLSGRGRAAQPIASLNPYNNNWVIKAKVVSKGQKRRWGGCRLFVMWPFCLFEKCCGISRPRRSARGRSANVGVWRRASFLFYFVVARSFGPMVTGRPTHARLFARGRGTLPHWLLRTASHSC